MYSILHDFYIRAQPSKIFQCFTNPSHLDKWWTLKSEGKPKTSNTYRFYFSEEYDWEAVVEGVKIDQYISFRMSKTSPEWEGSIFGINLFSEGEKTKVEFFHKDWKEQGSEYRRTNYCWANLLYLLKVYIEKGESFPFEGRDRSA